MLRALKGAKETITIETFIYWGDCIGEEFADALIERSRPGVKVHIFVRLAL